MEAGVLYYCFYVYRFARRALCKLCGAQTVKGSTIYKHSHLALHAAPGRLTKLPGCHCMVRVPGFKVGYTW